MNKGATILHYCSARALQPWAGLKWGFLAPWVWLEAPAEADQGLLLHSGTSICKLDEEGGTWLKMVAQGIWIYSAITNNQWQYPTNNKYILYYGPEACVARLKTCIEDGLLQGWELHSSAHAVVVFAFPLWKHTGKSRASIFLAIRLPQTYQSLIWEKI